MKKLLTLLLLSALVVSSCGEKTTEEKIEDMEKDAENLENGNANDAVEYNDGLVGMQGRVYQYFIELGNAEEHEDKVKIVDKALAECDDVLASLDDVKPYSGGRRLLNALIASIEVNQKSFEKLKRMLEIEGQEEYTEEDEAEYNELLETLDEGEAAADAEFEAAQQEFARNNNMTLTENPLDEEMEKAFE